MRFLILCLTLFFSFTLSAKETRCGWLENPSPANMWLIDSEGVWDITLQGIPNNLSDKSLDLAYQAIANDKEFVRTNSHYGFSCACLSVDVDKQKKQITTIYTANQLSLKRCLEDISITKHIPLRFK